MQIETPSGSVAAQSEKWEVTQVGKRGRDGVYLSLGGWGVRLSKTEAKSLARAL